MIIGLETFDTTLLLDNIERYSDSDVHAEDSSIFTRYLAKTLLWCTSEGKYVLVHRMTDRHIEKCLTYENYPNKKNWDVIFNVELYRRKKGI